MGVKHFRPRRGELAALLEKLEREYHIVKIVMPGSPEHGAKGLAPDVYLVRAWNDVRRAAAALGATQ